MKYYIFMMICGGLLFSCTPTTTNTVVLCPPNPSTNLNFDIGDTTIYAVANTEKKYTNSDTFFWFGAKSSCNNDMFFDSVIGLKMPLTLLDNPATYDLHPSNNYAFGYLTVDDITPDSFISGSFNYRFQNLTGFNYYCPGYDTIYMTNGQFQNVKIYQ